MSAATNSTKSMKENPNNYSENTRRTVEGNKDRSMSDKSKKNDSSMNSSTVIKVKSVIPRRRWVSLNFLIILLLVQLAWMLLISMSYCLVLLCLSACRRWKSCSCVKLIRVRSREPATCSRFLDIIMRSSKNSFLTSKRFFNKTTQRKTNVCFPAK